jgi:hypothetical protein
VITLGKTESKNTKTNDNNKQPFRDSTMFEQIIIWGFAKLG